MLRDAFKYLYNIVFLYLFFLATGEATSAQQGCFLFICQDLNSKTILVKELVQIGKGNAF